MAQPMMRWVNVSLSSRLFIVFSVSSVSLCPLCLNKNPSTTFLHDIVARCWTLCSTQRTQRNFVISHQRLYRQNVHHVLRVLCVSVSSVFKQTRRLRSCMTSSLAV